ncbi:MAG: hypothetical protein WKF58_06695 [Ilumatobacteraceae bacterium]
MSTRTLPHGSWPSPITAASLVAGAATVVEVRADGHDIWWSESRPDEGGRLQLVRRSASGSIDELFPPPTDAEAWNARTALHEYGGGAWNVRDGVVLFSNWSDQRMYRAGIGVEPDCDLPDSVGRAWMAMERADVDRRRLASLRARVARARRRRRARRSDERARAAPSRWRRRLRPDARARARHRTRLRARRRHAAIRSPGCNGRTPTCRGTSTTLHTATIDRGTDGQPVGITGARRLAGGASESVVQPGFTDDDELIACSDRSGWWNPYRYRLDDGGSDGADSAGGGNDDGAGVPLLAGVEAEIGGRCGSAACDGGHRRATAASCAASPPTAATASA